MSGKKREFRCAAGARIVTNIVSTFREDEILALHALRAFRFTL